MNLKDLTINSESIEEVLIVFVYFRSNYSPRAPAGLVQNCARGYTESSSGRGH